jgi:hypothetical protein
MATTQMKEATPIAIPRMASTLRTLLRAREVRGLMKDGAHGVN